MAVNVRQLFPNSGGLLDEARDRRVALGRYIRLDGGRYLIVAALVLAVMSLISLGQTGRLATQGYQISDAQVRHQLLLRQRSTLLLDLAEVQSLDTIQQRAKDLGLRPMDPKQTRYISVSQTPVTVVPSGLPIVKP